jgi:hypothetical protein
MTKIVDSAEGEKKNWAEVLTVIAWLAGKPTGGTT